MRATRTSRCGISLVFCALAIGATAAYGQRIDLQAIGGQFDEPAGAVKPDEAAKFTAVYQTVEGKPTEGRLQVTCEVAPDWYIYSAQQAPPPLPLKISLAKDSPAKVAGKPVTSVEPKVSTSDVWPDVQIEKHTGTVQWNIPLELSAEAAANHPTLRVEISGQVCSEAGSCVPLREKTDAQFTGTYATEIAPAPEVAPAPVAAREPPVEIKPYRNAGAHVSWSVWVEPATVAPGETATLYLHARPDESYHFYPYTDGSEGKTKAATLIVPVETGELVAGTPQTEQQVVTETIMGLSQTYYPGAVIWQIPLQVPPDAKAGTEKLRGLIGFQTCNDNQCDPPVGAWFTALVRVGSQADGVVPAVLQDEKFKVVEDALKTDPAERSEKFGATAAVGGGREDLRSRPLLGVLAIAFLGGFVLNFMPCVFPVIGLKVMSFIQQADGDRRRVFTLNLWYVIGMLSVFWALAAFAVALRVFAENQTYSWGMQFSDDRFTIGLMVLVFAMALSFLGVWELPIPGFASGRSASGLQQREGPAGALFKGIFTTLLATPCSGPGLGAVFAYTAANPVEMTPIAFTAIGLGMASPYLLLGLFPGLAHRLPHPGPWMETFKHLMGFVLLFVTAWLFFSVGNQLTRPTFVCLIGVWLGCWIAGRVAMYEPVGRRLRFWAFGGTLAALIGMFSYTSLQSTSTAMVAVQEGKPDTRVVKWQPYSEERLHELQAQGKTVMLDFTADWCWNCQWNSKFAINTQEVGELVRELNAVPLLADWSDMSEDIQQKIAELQSASIPLLAIYPGSRPNEPIVLRDIVTKETVLNALREAGASQDTLTVPEAAEVRPVRLKTH